MYVAKLRLPVCVLPLTPPGAPAVQVKMEINRLIEEHQKMPGNILRGLMERVIEWPKSKAS